MSFPEPRPGLVIRYSYLWRSEALRGQEEGRKDRPCVVVVAISRGASGTKVFVAPIAHSNPGSDPAIELPSATKQRLKLDDSNSWIITSEVNAFIWPGPDVRFIERDRSDSGIAYGYLPGNLTEAVLNAIRSQLKAGTVKPVDRG